MIGQMKKSALFLFADGVEELELIAPVDVLRRAGVEVTMASLGEGIYVQTRGGITLHVDAMLDQLNPLDFDMLVLPGGPGVVALRQSGLIATAVKQFAPTGKPIAAICAAPLLLHDAGLLATIRYTSHNSCWAELPQSIADETVVIDQNIITSRGAGTALEFGLVLVEILCGRDARVQIEAAIMI
jgi:4-methyl-5(b-hydroxyethyl)-thiazole monophosphate biosynthesis